MSLYGLYLRNPSGDLIFLRHMESTYIAAVHGGLILIFLVSWRNEEFFEKM